ncbi:MAG: flagellar biosynthetic protein FliO [Treponema sp.]|jgi:flagellar protein FliO/FliZ|nr:flagellar biosynthetic protein FliO [Treponema sp.]
MDRASSSSGRAAQTLDETDRASSSSGRATQALGETDRASTELGRETERGYLLGESAVPAGDGGGSPVWAVFRVVLALALAAVAIYGVVYLLKRKKTDNTPDDTYLKVLASVPLNIKTSASVIAVGRRAWLTGISDANVSLIAEITDQETVDAMLLAYSGRTALSKNIPPLNFTGLLRKFAGASGNHSPRTGAAVSQADFPDITAQTVNLKRNRERLKNL